MDLGNSILRLDKQEIIIKSIIWNTIIEIFQEKKKIDITKYLVSIKLKGPNILVKTNKPIINAELYLINDELTGICKEKINKLGLSYKDFQIKFL